MVSTPWLRLLYKSLAVALISYALVGGLMLPMPDIGGNLQQTSRNLFYHLPMWFAMYLQQALSAFYSLQYIRRARTNDDLLARESARLAVLFGVLGLATGSLWSRVTWGALLPGTDPAAWWAWDPKQTGALVALFIYLAYLLLRASLQEPIQRARVAAVYNLFALASIVPLTLILPRALGGLHPGGSEGSPVFNSKDLAPSYRLVLYPSIIGFLLLSCWLLELRVRLARLQQPLVQPAS